MHARTSRAGRDCLRRRTRERATRARHREQPGRPPSSRSLRTTLRTRAGRAVAADERLSVLLGSGQPADVPPAGLRRCAECCWVDEELPGERRDQAGQLVVLPWPPAFEQVGESLLAGCGQALKCCVPVRCQPVGVRLIRGSRDQRFGCEFLSCAGQVPEADAEARGEVGRRGLLRLAQAGEQPARGGARVRRRPLRRRGR